MNNVMLITCKHLALILYQILKHNDNSDYILHVYGYLV